MKFPGQLLPEQLPECLWVARANPSMVDDLLGLLEIPVRLEAEHTQQSPYQFRRDRIQAGIDLCFLRVSRRVSEF